MSDATLPGVRAALVDPGGTTSRPFYAFFQSQATNLVALSDRVSVIESTPSSASNLSPNANVIGAYSIAVQGTLRTGIVRVLLEGDVEFAGATNYYGSDSTGAKGWYAISDALADSANIIKSVDTGGVTSFDLSDVTVGSGGTLQKYGFDAKGRLNNQSAATTSDLAEGSNLYFTAARVLSTVLAGLSTASSSVITAADSVLSSFGKLQAQISAVVTSLAGYVQTTRTISTTAPLTGGGDLSANRTLAIPAATTSVSGYLTSTDWTTFNDKVPSTRTITAGTGLSGGGDLSANRTVSMGTPSTLTGATTNSATGTTHTHALTITKSDVGLGNVDNTSDASKPVSTAQATAIQGALDQSAFKNRLINGDFAINQRAFAGGALAAGAYGFDRWKAGTGGCNVSLSGGVLTHTSGPLVQVIEAPMLASQTVTVSVEDPSGSLTVNIDGVTGTITAGAGRRGVALTVPSGSTGNVTLTLTAAGVTYSRIQLEVGSTATQWDQRPVAAEMNLCLRYFYATSAASGSAFCIAAQHAAGNCIAYVYLPSAMRIIPACSINSGIAFSRGGVVSTSTSLNFNAVNPQFCQLILAFPAAGTIGFSGYCYSPSSAMKSTFDAEL